MYPQSPSDFFIETANTAIESIDNVFVDGTRNVEDPDFKFPCIVFDESLDSTIGGFAGTLGIKTIEYQILDDKRNLPKDVDEDIANLINLNKTLETSLEKQYRIFDIGSYTIGATDDFVILSNSFLILE